jgi:uncharacterized membrane protein YhaH (DUF805 family)
VSPVQAVASAFDRYATFSGRWRRSEFWWFVAFDIALTIVISILVVLLPSGGAVLAWIFVFLGTLVPYLAVGARRLHDIGRSGWWQLLSLVPLGNLLLLYWWVLPSDSGPNAYGPAPIGTY